MKRLVILILLAFSASHAAGGIRIISLPALLSELAAMEITDFDNRKVGEVEDLLVDTANAQVRYAIVEIDGRRLAYPFAALELSLDKRRLILRASPERIARAPDLDPLLFAIVDSYWDGPEPPVLVRASQLLKEQIADAVVDAHEGAVAFALVAPNDGTLYPVPVGAPAQPRNVLERGPRFTPGALESALENRQRLQRTAAYVAGLGP